MTWISVLMTWKWYWMENTRYVISSKWFSYSKGKTDERHGYKIWTYAVHFDWSLPDENPDDFKMQLFLKNIILFYEDIYDNLTKSLLSHLTVGWNALYLMVV